MVKGWSGGDLLDSYSSECVAAAREICEEAGKSTRFMTPPTPGSRLMRDAVLSLSLAKSSPRISCTGAPPGPHEYRSSPLDGPEADPKSSWRAGVAIGHAARNVKLGEDDYLFDRLGARPGFCVLVFAGADGLRGQLAAILAAAGTAPFPVIRAPSDARMSASPRTSPRSDPRRGGRMSPASTPRSPVRFICCARIAMSARDGARADAARVYEALRRAAGSLPA